MTAMAMNLWCNGLIILNLNALDSRLGNSMWLPIANQVVNTLSVVIGGKEVDLNEMYVMKYLFSSLEGFVKQLFLYQL